jgi:hypothetical protein
LGFLGEQLLSVRTREAYLAAVRAFAVWLRQRDGSIGEALSLPRGRDLAARDYKRDMKIERGLVRETTTNEASANNVKELVWRRRTVARGAPRSLLYGFFVITLPAGVITYQRPPFRFLACPDAVPGAESPT